MLFCLFHGPTGVEFSSSHGEAFVARTYRQNFGCNCGDAAIVATHLLRSGKGEDEVIKERLCKCPVLFITFSISSPPQSFQVWQIEMDKATAGNAFSTSGTASAVVDSGKAEVGASENEIKDTKQNNSMIRSL
jgi:hypothetical protein